MTKMPDLMLLHCSITEPQLCPIERRIQASRGGGGGVLWEFLGGDVPLGPWNP